MSNNRPCLIPPPYPRGGYTNLIVWVYKTPRTPSTPRCKPGKKVLQNTKIPKRMNVSKAKSRDVKGLSEVLRGKFLGFTSQKTKKG